MPLESDAVSGGRQAGKVILITGASGDIGRAIAERLSCEGASLALLDLEAPLELVRNLPGPALPMACDVSDAASVVAAVDACVAKFGRLDGVVNNAATATEGLPVTELSLDAWNRTLAVNLTGAMLIAREAIPHMRRPQNAGGVILNVASQLGQVGAAGRAAYAVSKAGLIQLARSLAVDHAQEGIRALSLSPGAVLTSRLERRYGSAEAAEAALGARYLTGRLGTPQEVAAMAAHLLSDEAAFMTGCDVLVDGGYLAV
ncbi:3-ketoacyl-ACP reductase (plasmid) [Antarctobacter heliothermus]|uniref:3-ketoacyl-ACP reductase n=1 Tax=Antarctobacter heliothermus TaxID=74033 RepID=A0A222EBY3_9RHOB|nr:SDR family oxidoreductase [Antarctobacter heliothermus]ASP23703.1 3-ketoacyl-ACP reductase [Antarctobacter heliothermus]